MQCCYLYMFSAVKFIAVSVYGCQPSQTLTINTHLLKEKHLECNEIDLIIPVISLQ